MKLYHVTKQENVIDILRDGLIPQIGCYATEMEEKTSAVWLFPSIVDAEEMAPVWLEPFYGEELTYLEVTLQDDYPVQYSGSDYEVYVTEKIPPENIRIYTE